MGKRANEASDERQHMSFVALVTDDFETVVRFYGGDLGFPVLREWDRPDGRGCVFDARGMGLEILDNRREERPRELAPAGGRLSLVVEVTDVASVWSCLGIEAPEPRDVSWGARLFEVHDPDGVSVTFLEWCAKSETHDEET